MGGEWKKVQLDEIAIISSGKRPAKVSKQPTEECTVPIIGGGGVSGYTNRALFEEGVLITGRVGTLGKLFSPSYPCWPSDNTLVIHISEANVDGTYLRYAVELSIPQVAAMNRGAANPLITQGDIGRLNIPLPPPPEQRAIAHILGTLDDKIELNRRMNETLEAMAQALFKSWFVDFDPVVINAIKAGNPIPEKFAERAAHYRAPLENPSPNGRGAGVRGKEKSKKEKLPPHLLSFARQLRKNQTNAEALLWSLLRGRRFLGVKFRRQHPVPPYILDFYSHETKLAIEVDGSQHNLPEQRRRDEKRTAYLAEKGIRVLRFWSDQVLRETEAVLERIYEAVAEALGTAPSPSIPLPAGEGGKRFSRRVTGWVDGADLHLPPEDILRLFPDRFVDSELGPIPEGWEVKRVSDFAKLKGGKQLPKKYIAPKGPVPVFGGAGVMGYTNKHNAEGFIITVGRIGAYCGQFFRQIGKAWINNNASLVNVFNDELGEWLFLSLRNADIDVIKKGAAQPFVSNGDIERLPILWPGKDIAIQFSAGISTLKFLQDANERESRALADLRDTLLPKLISGELRVPDVEKILEDVE